MGRGLAADQEGKEPSFPSLTKRLHHPHHGKESISKEGILNVSVEVGKGQKETLWACIKDPTEGMGEEGKMPQLKS